MSELDVRWQQRLVNYQKALIQLKPLVEIGFKLSDWEKLALIKLFELCHELAWLTLKDLLEFQGNERLMGSRDTFVLANQRGLLDSGVDWIEMIKDRNKTAHSYNQAVADEIAEAVIETYYPMMSKLEITLWHIKKNEIQD